MGDRLKKYNNEEDIRNKNKEVIMVTVPSAKTSVCICGVKSTTPYTHPSTTYTHPPTHSSTITVPTESTTPYSTHTEPTTTYTHPPTTTYTHPPTHPSTVTVPTEPTTPYITYTEPTTVPTVPTTTTYSRPSYSTPPPTTTEEGTTTICPYGRIEERCLKNIRAVNYKPGKSDDIVEVSHDALELPEDIEYIHVKRDNKPQILEPVKLRKVYSKALNAYLSNLLPTRRR